MNKLFICSCGSLEHQITFVRMLLNVVMVILIKTYYNG